MADIKLRIEVNPNAESEFLGAITNDNARVSNTSIKVDSINQFVNPPTSEFDGSNGLLWGKEDYLVFNDNDELDNVGNTGGYLESEENPSEFFWGLVPPNKEYSVKLTFTGARNLKDIVVFGDKVNDQFPTEAIVDGEKTIYNDDYYCAINLGVESDSHTIEFTKWNRANYNACLTLIRVMLQYYDIDIYNGLKSVESLSQSSPNTNGIFYSSLESSGSAEMVDANGELGDLLDDGAINNSNVTIKILINGREVQNHISNTSNYNSNSKVLSIELGNRLNTLDILKYNGFNYSGYPSSLANLLFDVLSNLRYALFGADRPLKEREFEDMLSDKYNETGITLYKYLTDVIIKYPMIETNKTYREVLDEFCLIAQMQMYIDDNNNVRFVSARPIMGNKNFNAIHIPKKNMFSQLDYSVIVENKYDNILVKTAEFYYEKEQSIGDTQNLTYNEFTDNKWTIKTDEIPSAFEYKQTVEYLDNGAQRYYGEIKVEFNFDEPYVENAIIKYSPTLYKYQGTSLVPDNSAGVIYLNLPGVTERPSTFKPSPKDKYTPVVYTEYNNARNKIILHLCFWVGGAIGGSGDEYVYLANNEIKIVADKLKYNTFNVIQNNGNNSLEFTNTNLLIQDESVANTIINNILNDYSLGISNASVSISCDDYFDVNGKEVIDWSKGELPQVNQIVYFDGDIYKDQTQRYWKIKGRNFRKTGVPMIDLELQEVKVVD